jgi:hypothetical protein
MPACVLLLADVRQASRLLEGPAPAAKAMLHNLLVRVRLGRGGGVLYERLAQCC